MQVYDNDGAFELYELDQPVTVMPDLTNFETTKERLIAQDPLFKINIILNQGSYLSNIIIIQSISSLLNTQSLSDKLGILTNISFPETYEPLLNYSEVIQVFKIKNKKILNTPQKFSNLTKDTMYDKKYLQHK